MVDFARAMLERDEGLAAQVGAVEGRLGPASDKELAVIAQAGHLCWGNLEYRRNLLWVCEAIRAREPTSLYYHRQVTPERWAAINAYIVGVQHWLSPELRAPDVVDGSMVPRIATWLGDRTPAREALVTLFLVKLLDHASLLVLAPLGEPVDWPGDYQDFRAWHVRPEGVPTFADDAWSPFVESCRQYATQEASPEAADELVNGILEVSPPPCVHRYTRYLDIQLTSIGALSWRGNLPPNDVPVEQWEAFLAEVHAALRGWINSEPPSGDLASEVHEALGEPTEWGRAIVADFLLAENRGGEEAWGWMEGQAAERGLRAADRFGTPDTA